MDLHTASLRAKKTLTDNIIELRLDKPKNFDFIAGQFIQISVPHEGKQIFRSYSISSIPSDTYIELCIKLYETGIASKLFATSEIGDTLSFKGPAGRFTLDDSTGDVYFIATGVGIAPIMGIIRDELEAKNSKNRFHLIFGVRHEKDVFWIDRLEALQKKYNNFTYSLTLSQPRESWTGLRGRVTEHIPQDTSNLRVFLCGSAEMVRTVREMLLARGTEVSKIHFEIF